MPSFWVESQIGYFQNSLDLLNAKGIPFAVRSTLNDMAFHARKVWQDQVKQDLTIRSKFIPNSIRVVRAKGYDIDEMESLVGAVKYQKGTKKNALALLEEGEKRKGGKYGAAVPALSGRRSGSYAKKLKALSWWGAIETQSKKEPQGSSIEQRQAIAIHMAQKQGRQYVFMPTASGQWGIFRIQGDTVKMLWVLKAGGIETKPHPYMAHAVESAYENIGRLYLKALKFQCRRVKLF